METHEKSSNPDDCQGRHVNLMEGKDWVVQQRIADIQLADVDEPRSVK